MSPAVQPVATEVRAMFDRIAQRYDAANSVLSLGLHHLWKRRLAARAAQSKPERVLDICCGTGDVLRQLKRRLPDAQLAGSDFSRDMLNIARRRLGRSANLLASDALGLPFADRTFDSVTVAFGVRNLQSVDQGLAEARRVLKQGGELLILEFGQPRGVWGALFSFYSRQVLPRLGALITGNRTAYDYLHNTSASFPCGPSFVKILSHAGYDAADGMPLLGGVVYLYSGRRNGRA